jgi:hypothetical protein
LHGFEALDKQLDSSKMNNGCTEYCRNLWEQVNRELLNQDDDLRDEEMPTDEELFGPGNDTEKERLERLRGDEEA